MSASPTSDDTGRPVLLPARVERVVSLVNSIETGRYDPSLPLAIAIARHFHRTVEEIFHVED